MCWFSDVAIAAILASNLAHKRDVDSLSAWWETHTSGV